MVILPVFYVLSAYGWDLTLRFLGYPIGFGRAQVAWGQPLLARYVPGSVLYVLGRVLLSERAGVPRRITIASIVYEQAISATSAIIVAAYFIINHPDLQGDPIRWAVLLLIPAAIALLHPRVFGPLANRALKAFGREPLPAVISLRGIVALIVFYSLNWVVVAFGIYCVARSVTYIPFDDILLVGSAQAIGYFAALVTIVAPAGLGVRDAAFAWAVKAAVPGRSFAVGSLIAIAVRGVMTVAELIYVGAVAALGRREGWSIATGILHPSPEEREAGIGGRRPLARDPLERDAGAELVGGEGEGEELEGAVAGDRDQRQRPDQVPGQQPGGGEQQAEGGPGGGPYPVAAAPGPGQQVDDRGGEEGQRPDPHRIGIEAGEAGEGDREAEVAGPPLVFPGQPERVQPIPPEAELRRHPDRHRRGERPENEPSRSSQPNRRPMGR